MGKSKITFTNSAGAKMYVAYMRLDYSCKSDCGDPWDVLGWIGLNPGETKARANPTKNKYFYYYAEDVKGRYWAGSYVAEVSDSKFEKCTCVGVHVQDDPYYNVGFRELNTNKYSGVNFVS